MIEIFNVAPSGDVNGSVEAILDTLSTYRSDLCQLEVVSHGVGEVTEHDIQLAETFKGEKHDQSHKQKSFF